MDVFIALARTKGDINKNIWGASPTCFSLQILAPEIVEPCWDFTFSLLKCVSKIGYKTVNSLLTDALQSTHLLYSGQYLSEFSTLKNT